jgi:hypothetical protein
MKTKSSGSDDIELKKRTELLLVEVISEEYPCHSVNVFVTWRLGTDIAHIGRYGGVMAVSIFLFVILGRLGGFST